MFKELWFLENPIETAIGIINFIKVRDYEKLLIYSSILQTNKNEVIKFIKNNNPSSIETKQFIEGLNQIPFIDIIKSFEQLGLYNNYTDLFNLCFENKGSFDLIQTDEELEFYVNLIKEMNKIEFEKPNPNPELAYYDKLKRLAMERKGEVVTFKSMVMNVGLRKDNVLDISIYNLYEYFNSLATNKNFDTTVLYQTVSTEKLPLTPWYADTTAKRSELDESDKQFISKHMGMVRNDPSKNKNGVVKNINDSFKNLKEEFKNG